MNTNIINSFYNVYFDFYLGIAISFLIGVWTGNFNIGLLYVLLYYLLFEIVVGLIMGNKYEPLSRIGFFFAYILGYLVGSASINYQDPIRDSRKFKR